jgi:hypothetical protein
MKQTIDLRGPDGNAMALIGMAKNFERQMGNDNKKTMGEFLKLGSYENIVAEFKKRYKYLVEIIEDETECESKS